MLNKDFQELKRQYSVVTEDNRKMQIVQEMRNNLIARNNGNASYITEYITPGIMIDISIAGVESLFEVDGDMCPLGK